MAAWVAAYRSVGTARTEMFRRGAGTLGSSGPSSVSSGGSGISMIGGSRFGSGATGGSSEVESLIDDLPGAVSFGIVLRSLLPRGMERPDGGGGS